VEKYRIKSIAKTDKKIIDKYIFIGKSKRHLDELVSKNKERSIYISKFKTELTMDKYALIINRVLNDSLAALRSHGKSMMTPRGKSEAHITTRAKHQQQVGDIAEEVATELQLNPYLARTMADHHDDGHTFNGHGGERIMSSIGMLLNCGYTVHNALSIDMLISEEIIAKIKESIRIQDPAVTEEELDKVEEELWIYVFDGILAHNGEGTDRAIKPEFGKTKEDVIQQKNNCYRRRGYDKQIKPTTMEGAILRFADIIAYTRTDILDGFRLKLIKDFDEKGVQKSKNQDVKELQGYLKVIGTILSYRNKILKCENNTSKLDIDKENAIIIIRNRLERKKNQLVFEMKKVEEVISKKDIEGNEEELVKAREHKLILEEEKVKIEKKLEEVNRVYEEYNKIKIEEARKYIQGIDKKQRKEVISNMIKDVFISDLKNYSKDKDYIGFSPAITETIFKLRDYNMDYIVKYTRRDFEKKVLPSATLKLVKSLAKTLIDTGVIYEKVLPDKYKSKLQPLGNQKIYMQEREKISGQTKKENNKIKRLITKPSTILKRLIVGDSYKYKRKVLHRCENMFEHNKERLKEICENAIEAIDDIAREDLKVILGEKEMSTSLPREYSEKIEYLKKLLKSEMPDLEIDKSMSYLSDEAKGKMLKIIREDAQKNIELILASAIAKEYVEGMSDNTIIDALQVSKIISPVQAMRARSRNNNKFIADADSEKLKAIWASAEKNHREGTR